jgi:hypothetical protein
MPESHDTHVERNATELERLRAVGAGVLAGEITPRLPGGWTASAVFAHLAFWDRLVIARWDRYDREGVIDDLPDAAIDLVNDAALPLWLALSGGAAVVQAIDAAIHVCERIASLSPAAVAAALQTDRLWMVDRTYHWSPHLDALTGVPDAPSRVGNGRLEPLAEDAGRAQPLAQPI